MGRSANNPHPLDHLCLALFLARREQEKTGMVVADLTGVSRTALSNWEHGVTRPTSKHLIRWAEVLGYELTLVKKQKPL